MHTPRVEVIEDLILRMCEGAETGPPGFTPSELLSAVLTLTARVIEVILERVPSDQRQDVVASVTHGLMRIMPVPYNGVNSDLPQTH